MGAANWTAVVLTGGTSSRFGGSDKTAADVSAGRTSVDLILDELPSDVPVVVAGPAAHTNRPAVFCREHPPHGGPVAGLAAALARVSTPVIVLLAGDQPFAGRLAEVLASEFDPATSDALVPIDDSGRRQSLCAAYGVDAVRGGIERLGSVEGVSMRELLGHLNVVERPLSRGDLDSFVDIDTPDDLAAARRRAEGR